MVRKLRWLPLISVLALSLLTACTPSEAEIEYGMTEAEEAQMAEVGYVNADNAAEASRIAGFPVAVPAYIPEGFVSDVFSVSQLGATLPEGIGPEDKPVNVAQTFQGPEGTKSIFSLVQSDLGLSLGDSEPAEFCGYSGLRYYREADGEQPPMVVLGWEVDGIGYTLAGNLYGPVDEATLVEIACSVAVP